MATKITYILTKPTATTGSDDYLPLGLTPAAMDQNLANLQAAVDSKAPTASPVFTGTVTSSLAAGVAFDNTSGTTSQVALRLQNGGGRLYCGVEGAIAAIISGAGAYDASIVGQAGISFSANNGASPQLRLDTSGNLLVGVTSGSYHTFVKNNASNLVAAFKNSSTSSPFGVDVVFTGVGGGTGGYFLTCGDNTAGTRFTVLGNGNAQNLNNSYGAFSDIKLKENISLARDYLADLCRVVVVKYSLKADALAEANLLGVIAQELEEIFPGMVETTNDTAERPSGRFEQKEITPAVMDGSQMVSPPVYGDDLDKPIMERYETGETTKGVKYSVFVPMLIKAVQELSARLAALEAA